MAESKKTEGRSGPFKGAARKLSLQFGDKEADMKLLEYEREIEKLQVQVASMEQQINQAAQTRTQLEQSFRQNEKLAAALVEARHRMEVLKVEVEKLSAPPASYAVFSDANKDGTVNVYVSGRKMKVNAHPNISIQDLKRGQQVVLNEALNAVEVCGFDLQGEVVHIKGVLGDGRAIVRLRTEEERVVELAEPLLSGTLSVGDPLLFDARSGYAVEKLPRIEIEDVVLEEIPDVTYANIGGLDAQIELVRDAVELPFLYQELYAEYKLLPPKGVLLYGPPGCGKTLIAKAVAASIAKKLEDRCGKEVRSFFLHVKGPELLDKYVGESERKIREIFKKARDRAEDGAPVIIFFDEMDALFRTRGTGISSDMESTIVPQFLSEIDGLERLRNVIVIGATNRQDLLDPAILRAGRLDIKIKIDRPDKSAAHAIFRKYLTVDLPYHSDEIEAQRGDREAVVTQLIEAAVAEMYSLREENKFLEVGYANGEREILYFKDFSSGAMMEGIVSRAKKYAIKRMIEKGEKGLTQQDLLRAIRDEFRENEDLPNTTNPDDWAKIAGRRSEKIVHVRPIAGQTEGKSPAVETVSTGHYL